MPARICANVLNLRHKHQHTGIESLEQRIDVRVGAVLSAAQVDEEVAQQQARTPVEVIVPISAAGVVAVVDEADFERSACEQPFTQFGIRRRRERKRVERARGRAPAR